MSRQADIKIRLAPDLKRSFDQWCREAETTMTAQLVRLIQSSVDGDHQSSQSKYFAKEASTSVCNNELTEAEPIEQAAPIDEIQTSLVNIADRIEELVDAHPQFWFEKWFSKHAAQEELAFNKLGRRQSEHHAATNETLRSLRSHITAIAQMVQCREPPFYQNYKIWTAACAGALALLLILALIPGESALSRFAALKMVGAANPIHAAEIIAGGDAWHGKLIFETGALMKSEPFASNFAHCVEKAKRSKKPFSCTLQFPIIV